jgi:Xaa-Pro dipeptidase
MNRLLRKKLDAIFSSCKSIDRIVLVNSSKKDPNFTYLTGIKGGSFEECILLVDRRGLTLCSYSLEYDTAVEQRFSGLKVIKIEDSHTLRALLSSAIKGKRIGINGSFLTSAKYLAIRKRYKPKRIVDVQDSFTKARVVKYPEELANLRKAARITRTALEKIRRDLRPGVTERDVARRFDDISERLGSEGPSFGTVVCFGKNSALPHHLSDNTRLKYGDLVLIDAGATVNNYCSDMTRTFIFEGAEGKYRAKNEELIRIVKQAQDMAIKGIRPGMGCDEADQIARSYLDTVDGGKYKGRFTSALGHTVGVEVHDGEALSPGVKLKLKENMVFTVEPGIYVPGLGGARLEDDIVITKKGCKII